MHIFKVLVIRHLEKIYDNIIDKKEYVLCMNVHNVQPLYDHDK